jgi:hypothetical protein
MVAVEQWMARAGNRRSLFRGADANANFNTNTNFNTNSDSDSHANVNTRHGVTG